MNNFAKSLLIAFACMTGCGPGGGPSTWNTDWVVGTVFEGSFGLSVGESSSVRWLVINDDGTWSQGYTTSCQPGDTMPGGTWVQIGPEEIELQIEGGAWPAAPNTDVVRISPADVCGSLVYRQIREDGELDMSRAYSNGVPCLSDCDGSGDREIIVCAGETSSCP